MQRFTFVWSSLTTVMDGRRLRLIAYIRVSQRRGRDGESFQSPIQQRERIEMTARAFGHEIVDMYEEIDESGTRADRPLLQRALRRIEAGEVDGLAVYKIDRFGRSQLDGLLQLRRLRSVGGVLISAGDGLDSTTPAGRQTMGILLSIAEGQVDAIRDTWHESKARAVRRGVHPSAVPPFGYRRDRDARGKLTGPLVVGPVTGPIVTDIFERAAGGEGWTSIARWLNVRGIKTQHGRDWTPRAVKMMLRNEVYLGVAFARSRKDEALTVRNPDAHPPLTTPDVWQRAQRPGIKHAARGARPNPLAGILRCAGCRYTLRPGPTRTRKDGTIVHDFMCQTGIVGAAGCPAPARAVDDGSLLAHIERAFFDALPQLAAIARRSTPELAAIEREVERDRRAFAEWRDDPRVQEQLGMDAYLAGLQARQEKLTVTLDRLAEAQAAARTVILPASVDAIRDRWSTFTSLEKRHLLASAIEAVFVRRAASRGEPATRRLHIVWRGEPVDLPVRGSKGWVPKPFTWDDSDGAEVGMTRLQDRR